VNQGTDTSLAIQVILVFRPCTRVLHSVIRVSRPVIRVSRPVIRVSIKTCDQDLKTRDTASPDGLKTQYKVLMSYNFSHFIPWA